MAYYRKTKNGDQTLIYTAKDRQIQELRKNNPYRGYWHCANNRRHLPTRTIRAQLNTLYRVATRSTGYIGTRKELEATIAQEQDIVFMLQERLAATIHMKYRGVYSSKASASGDPEYVRDMLNDAQYRVKYWQCVLYAYMSGI